MLHKMIIVLTLIQGIHKDLAYQDGYLLPSWENHPQGIEAF